MLLIDKYVGETPLELLERIRREKPELVKEKLSYAGRLDPMAEGQMLILVGDEENKNREKVLGLDKEYLATFLIGVKTDTGDILGLVEEDKKENVSTSSVKNGVKKEDILKKLEEIKKIKTQKYPWFSGRAVGGIKLFDHFKAGNTDIERPTRKVEIKEIELVNFGVENSESVKSYIFDSVSKVSGDFRQKEILNKWEKFFDAYNKNPTQNTMQTFQIKILVSSGTFIRVLTENFDFPTTLLKLKRTKIKSDTIYKS